MKNSKRIRHQAMSSIASRSNSREVIQDSKSLRKQNRSQAVVEEEIS